MKTFKTVIASCLIALSAACVSTAIFKSVKQANEVNASIPSGLYDACESATTVDGLWSAVKTAANKNYNNGTNYSGLWDWYWTTDVRSDGKMNDYYSSITNYTSSGQCGNYSKEGDCYNREHSIPKSWWNSPDPSGAGYPQTDIFIVIPTDGWVNSKRSDYPLGETNGGTYSSSGSFSKLGSSTYSGYTSIGTVFEVNDTYKGDFARIYFYALAKWNSYNFGQTSNGQKMFQNSTSKTSSNNYGLTAYSVSLLIKWHKADPVSTWESQRNERVYGLQGNRNPFVDHPEYANYIWGGDPIGGGSSSSSSSASSSTSTSSSTTTSSSSGSGGSQDILFAKGFGGYTSNSYSAGGTDYTGVANSTNSSGSTYALQVFNGSSGAIRGNQNSASSNFSARNTTTRSGYYISSVSLTVSGGTLDGSTSGRSVVYFGSSAFSNPTTAPSGTATNASPASSGQTTLTWTNSATTNNYFILYNLKTAQTALSANASTALTVTWTEIPSTVIAVTSVSLNKNSTTLTVGDEETLTATVLPNNATDKSLTWESNATSVATVNSSGKITAVAAGSATITVKSNSDNTKKATCSVTVNASSSSGDELTATILYSDYTGGTQSSGSQISTTKSPITATLSKGYKNTTYTHNYAGGTITFSGTSSVSKITGIVITASSSDYNGAQSGGSWSVSSGGGSVSASGTTITYTAGSSTGNSVTLANSKQLRFTQMVVSYEESSTPSTPVLSSIEISGYTTNFLVGDTFSFGGTVTAKYSNSPDADVTSSASFSGYNMSSAGSQTVTVSYTESGTTKTADYTITVVSASDLTTSSNYKLVTDASKLRVGDKIILVASSANYAMSTEQKTSNRGTVSIAKYSDNTVIQPVTDLQSLELVEGNVDNTFGLYTGSGYLYAASSSSNNLKTETTLSNNSSFTISISNNLATLVAQGSNTRNTINYNYNGGSPLFGCYSSPSVAVSIYKKLYSAAEYSKVFIDELSCDATGETAPSTDNWGKLNTRYTNEVGSDAKTTLVSATATEYKNPSSDAQYISEAMYLYDYVMVKYNKTSTVYAKFITGRASNGLIFNGAIYSNSNSNNLIAILIVIGIASATAAGLILTIRRRKEN